jgi:cysteine desulfurase
MDYAATSPVKNEVFEAMKPYFTGGFGNPSSIHWFGRQTRGAIDKARQTVAEFLNCDQAEIIFTSGGTESDNLAIRGIIAKFQNPNDKLQIKPKIQNSNYKQKPQIITSEFEHHAVLHTCKDLEKLGLAEITYIKPDKEGIIHVDDVEKAIKPNTVLVSIMYVNNEIGMVQPISEISLLISRYNESRIMYKGGNHNTLFLIPNTRILFHTDAVQAVEYQEMDVKKLGVDMLSLSAHKFGGPKGVGILFVKKGTPISAIQTGGAQEWHKRAGTENVASIIGMATAIQLLKLKTKNEKRKTEELKNYFIDQIFEKIPDVMLNGSREKRNPNNVNISFKYIEGEAILLNLDLAGIAASSGSACTSGSLEPSHVLLSIGLKHEDAHGSVRFTLGEKTTKEEIDYTIKKLVEIVKRLRKMSPFGK